MLLRENVFKVTVKYFSCIGEILPCVRNRGVDPLERFIENGDDALLYIQRRYGDYDLSEVTNVDLHECRAVRGGLYLCLHAGSNEGIITKLLKYS